jgi:nucleotide-binding universal stress UspA family protein
MSGLDGIPTNAVDARFGNAALPGAYGRTPTPALETVFPLLLALADDELAAAAIHLTSALAQARGAVPTVVRALSDPLLEPEHRNECRDALRRQVASAAGPVQWQCEVAGESPLEMTVGWARQLHAGLIVMGLRHHGVLQRARSRDLLHETLRVARVPVIAVRPEIGTLPQRVVVAIDFGAASIRAAILARRLLADDGTLYLVHVAAHDSDGTREELARVIEELSPAPGMTISSIVLHGDVQASIECCAQAVGADLLAVGSDHHLLFDRLFPGSVSMKLAQTAGWSTLFVPSVSGA